MTSNDRALATFTGLGHGTLHGYELTIPIFVPIWLVAFDASATQLGVAVAIGLGTVGVLAPIAGVLADRYGSKRLVSISIAGMGLSFAALGLADSLVGLTLALAGWGTAASLYHPAGLSLISRAADRRGTVLAYHGAGGNVGMVLVPLSAILLLAATDWRTVAVALAVPALLSLVVGVALSVDEGGRSTGDEDAPSTTADDVTSSTTASGGRAVATLRRSWSELRSLFVGGFVLVFAVQLLYGSYYRGAITFLPDVLGDLPIVEPVAVGGQEIAAGQLAYTGLLLLGVAGQYAGGLASDRTSPERALVVTLAALVAASLLFVPAAGAGGLVVLLVCGVVGFFLFAFAPIGQSLVAEYVAVDRHGLSYGVVYFGTFGVGAAGAAMAGAALDLGGIPALFGSLAALAGVATLGAVALARTAGRW